MRIGSELTEKSAKPIISSPRLMLFQGVVLMVIRVLNLQNQPLKY